MLAIHPETAEAVERWRNRDDVQGVIWVGSRSRGYGDALSDDDLEVVLTDEGWRALTPATSLERWRTGDRVVWDAQYIPVSELEYKTTSPRDLDRWPYEAARVLFDRHGAVEPVVRRIGKMSAEFRLGRVEHSALRALFAASRAAKTARRGHTDAARILVVEGVQHLARVLFALELRWCPLWHWLEPELDSLRDQGGVAELRHALRVLDAAPIVAAIESLSPRLTEAGMPPRDQWVDVFAHQVHFSNLDLRRLHDR